MSNEPRWTPGPWSARLVDEGLGGVFVVARGRVIADVEYPNDDANAKLIAAAPELYAVLETLMAATGPGDAAHLLAEERENIMSLLAKSRGEQS